MLNKTKKFLKIFYDAGYQTVHDDGIEHAGYLAFLALLSIFPFLIFLFAVAAELGKQDYGFDFIKELYSILPSNVVSGLAPTVNEILSGPPQGLLTIAIIGIIWTASGAVEGIRTILNRAYRVKNPPHYIFRRALSILQFIVFTLIMIIAMFFLTVIPSILIMLENKFVIFHELRSDFGSLKYFASAFALFLGVALSYFVLPNIKQSFFKVIVGAKICVILWLFVIEIFTNYVAYYHKISNVYGGLAGIIITLLFFYIMSIIYIYGAEFNYFLEKYLGHKIEEKE